MLGGRWSFETAAGTVLDIRRRLASGIDVTQDCRTARVLFVADLKAVHEPPVEELLRELDRLCPAGPAPAAAAATAAAPVATP
ncbi:MAG: hypothetical protein FJ125_07965 [Deltaproteobacteria bacterium]|nr:hypothetical protein [Deltaproteobacteria bacterium]